MQMVLLTALGVGGATIIGSVIGFLFKEISHAFSDIVLSFAAGVMLAAAVLGLILPSVESGGKAGLIVTIAGIFAGAFCLNLIDKLVPHLHRLVGTDTEEHHNANLSKVLLFVTAIAIHNLPEGIAAGVGLRLGRHRTGDGHRGRHRPAEYPGGHGHHRSDACGGRHTPAHIPLCDGHRTD